jgi:hypothetical protein
VPVICAETSAPAFTPLIPRTVPVTLVDPVIAAVTEGPLPPMVIDVPLIASTGSGTAGSGSGGPHAQVCIYGRCYTSGTIDTLLSTSYGSLSQRTAAAIAGLHGVSAAAGGLVLTDNRIVLPSSSSANLQPPTSVSVDGTDISRPRLGPR